PNTQYTVYVRNASVLRSMSDGNKVDGSYAGTVKVFQTTKSQELKLDAYFGTTDDRINEVNISEKKIQLNVDARYMQKYSQDDSDAEDYIVRRLPLSKKVDETAYNSYVSPKLTYYVTDQIYSGYQPDTVHVGSYYFKPSSQIAAVDKKGKVRLKGVGTVYVIAYNPETGHNSNVTLNITANPDCLLAKNIKLKVGNTVVLTDYLTYKQGSTKLTGYCNAGYQDLSIDVKSDEYFEIEPVKKNGMIQDYRITATSPGGKLEFTVTDKSVVKAGGQTAKIKVQSAAIDPVKGLKATDIVDTSCKIRYTYSRNNDFRTTMDGHKLAFRVEVQDNTGKLLKSYLINANASKVGVTAAGQTSYVFIVNGLTRLSGYTVFVTAVYGVMRLRR
ncbi:MAG: hypothetical protein K2M91_11600, partial [Lachnospiraceae bacterium]|nr:hypothetical protein [Lachnospiraceae bacterium]